MHAAHLIDWVTRRPEEVNAAIRSFLENAKSTALPHIQAYTAH